MNALRILPWVVCVLAAAPAMAQTDPVPHVAPATLYFQNREIITLYASLGPLSPQDRVVAAQRRLREAARADRPGEVTAVQVGDAFAVAIGDDAIFAVLPGDLEPHLTGPGTTVATAAATAARRLGDALRAQADQRRPEVVAQGALRAGIALAAALAALFALTRARRLLIRLLPSKAQRRMRQRAVIKGIDVLGPILKVLRFLIDAGSIVAVAVVVFAWLTYAFSQFPLTAPWGNKLADFLADTARTIGVGLIHGVPEMLLVVLILFVTRFFARGVTALFDAIENGRLKVRGVHPDTADATRRIALALVWVFGIAIAFPFIPGSDSEAFKGVSVLFGLMITLGSSGVISQAMSGLVVVFSRALKENEYVCVGEFEGTVTEVGALSTKIRTPRNEEITIPNSVLVSSSTRNYSRLAGENGVVLSAIAGIGYDAPWRQVHAMLIEAALRTPGLRSTPAPFVRQSALSAFCVDYTINAYLERPETRLAVLSDLHANIQDLFNENGIQIMTPAFESQPAEPIVVPKTKWFAPPALPPAQ